MKTRLILVLMLILLSSHAYSLGAAPAKTVLQFTPDSISEGKVRIIVDETPKQIYLKADGELGKYVELEKNSFIADEKETWISFKVNIPHDLPPGERTGGIIISEMPGDNEAGVVYALPAVTHKLIINVPYPGKYLNSKLFITNQGKDSEVMFTMALLNSGSDAIENAKALFVIKGPTNQELDVIRTESVKVESGKESRLVAIWETENPGNYLVDVTLEYDGKVLSFSEVFTIGKLDVEIERIEVNDFKIGQIAKMDIYLRNRWNKPVTVNGRVEITKDTKQVSAFNSVPVSLLEKSEGTMEAYWNTEGIDPGNYDINVKAEYEGKTSEKTFTSYVSADSISIKDPTGQVIKKTGSQNIFLLSIIVLVLIIINIYLFIYINKKLKQPPASGQQ